MIFFPTKELFEIESLKDKSFFNHIGEYVLKSQNDNGTIPSNADGSFDPWDFIESITAINFNKEIIVLISPEYTSKPPVRAMNRMKSF